MDASYNDIILNATERNKLIRYAITIGTRAKCSTAGLLRPLRMKDLRNAFRERDEETVRRIDEHRKHAEDYIEGKTELPSEFVEYFGGVPTKEQFDSYCEDLIRQEKSMLRNIVSEYVINVDYGYTPKRLMQFHKSLNPRVTFGYSNRLHEECDFELTDEVKDAFLHSSSLAELPEYEDDIVHDYGNLFFDSTVCLFYSDLQVYKGDRRIINTVSHEYIFEIDLTDEEMTAFIDFDDDKAANIATVSKLKAAN